MPYNMSMFTQLNVWSTIALAIIGMLAMSQLWRMFARRDHFPVGGKTVIITGGSQGMGRSVARLLAERGANVVIVARNVDKLKSAVAYISAAAANPEAQRFHFISADLTDAAESKRVLEEVTAWNGGRSPDIVWCIAGSAYPEFFVHTDTARLREQMDQNYWSAAYMAHAVLKDWLKPLDESAPKASSAGLAAPAAGAAETATRHIIFTSSVAAFYPLVGYAPYAPAKAALRSLSDALHQELRLYNGARRHGTGGGGADGGADGGHGPATDVQIHNIFPGTIYSPGYEQEMLTKPAVLAKLEESDEGQTEDQVAAASLRGLQNGEYLVTTTLVGSLLRGAAWCGSPRNNWLTDTLMAWVASFVWMWVQGDLDGKVSKWGVENGHPVTYRRAN